MAEALYRKYRPQIFEDVVGQEHIERTIKNAVDQDKVSHAYLFTGPRGTGKTTTARLLAKALLCEKGPTSEPDGTCEDCTLIAASEHPDVYELDAASRTGVENVREEIIGRVQFAPTRGRYKVYIIDEVHMLSTAAFNALLKTLEEPPSHVVFILATTDPQKVPETIHSRCQRFDFQRISTEAIVSRLGAICVEEGVEFEGDALELVAHRAAGGMRDALTSLEQLITFGQGAVTMDVAERMLGSLDTNDLTEIVRFIGMRDAASCFRWTADYVETGSDLAQFTRELSEHIRDMYVMSLAGADVALDVSDATRREMADELALFGPDRLARLLGVLGDLSAELKTSSNPRLSFEIALTCMVRPDSDLTLEALAERVEELEKNRGTTFSPPPGSAAAASPEGGEACGGTQEGAQEPSPDSACEQPSDRARESSVDAEDARSSRNDVPVVVQAAAEEGGGATAPAGGSPVSDGDSSQADSGSASAEQASSGDVLTSLGNPAALQRMWQAALSHLKAAKEAYAVLFLSVKVRFDDAAQTLVIEFPSENKFAFTAAQKPDVQAELSAALAHACDSQVGSVPYRLARADEAGEDPAAAERAVEPTATGFESVGAEPMPVEPATGIDLSVEPMPPEPTSEPEPAPTSEPEPASMLEPAPTPEPAPAPTPGPGPAPAEPVPDGADPAPAPADDEPSIDELGEMLSRGFGEGVSFSEVSE